MKKQNKSESKRQKTKLRKGLKAHEELVKSIKRLLNQAKQGKPEALLELKENFEKDEDYMRLVKSIMAGTPKQPKKGGYAKIDYKREGNRQPYRN